MSVALIEIFKIGLSAIFSISAISKILNLQTFKKAILSFRLPSRYSNHIVVCIIIMEFAASVFIVATAFSKTGLILVLALLTSFSVLIIISLRRGGNFPCSCFGETSSNPIGWWHIVRNAALILVTLYLFNNMDKQNYSSHNQVIQLMFVTLITLSWFAYQFILRRFKTSHFKNRNKSILNTAAPRESKNSRTKNSNGLVFSVESYLSKRKPLILLFVDFQFLPCRRLLTSSANLIYNLRKPYTIIVVAKNQIGDMAKTAKENNIEMVVENDSQIAQSFNIKGVPALVVIDLKGEVKQRFVGEKVIFTALAEPHFLNAGPEKEISVHKSVTYLPTVALDIISMVNQKGDFINLKDTKIRNTILVFWSPYCQACSGVLDELQNRKKQVGFQLRIILVAAANKGLDNYTFDEIVIDQRFKIGKQLNITGTPSVIIIATNKLNHRVAYSATGADEIIELLNYNSQNSQSKIYEPIP